MRAETHERDKRQERAARPAPEATAGPGKDETFTDHGLTYDNAGSQMLQTCGGEGRWDDVVQEYVRNAVGEGFLVGNAVVHDSGWWERDGRRLRLVLVEGQDQPRQRSWVLDRLLPRLGSR